MVKYDVVFFRDSKFKGGIDERKTMVYSLPNIDSTIKKAKEDGNSWGATLFTIHYNKNGEFFGAWKKKESRWYRTL